MNKVKVNDVIDLNKHLIGYVRRTPQSTNKTQIEGVFVGTVVNGFIQVGYSKLNVKAGDTFDLAYGINKAKGRALASDAKIIDYSTVPQGKFRKKFAKFVNRCQKYYKEDTVYFDTVNSNKSDIGDCQVV